MAIQINSLIQHAYQKTSLVGNGQVADGTQTRAALEDLKSVISKLNQQNLILSDVRTVDVWATDKILFAVKPDTWFEYENYDEMLATLDSHQIGDICHIKVAHDGFNYFSFVNYNGGLTFSSTPEWNKYMAELWPNIFVDQLPDRAIGVGREIAKRFVQLYPVSKTRLDSKMKTGLATEFTQETENVVVKPIQGEERAATVTYFKIETNARIPAKLRVTYYEQLPDLKIEDTLYVSNMYETLLEDGLCAELCLRYKLMDLLPTFQEEFDNSIRLIKRVNGANRPMTYDFSDNGTYMDNYYNGYAPAQWG